MNEPALKSALSDIILQAAVFTTVSLWLWTGFGFLWWKSIMKNHLEVVIKVGASAWKQGDLLSLMELTEKRVCVAQCEHLPQRTRLLIWDGSPGERRCLPSHSPAGRSCTSPSRPPPTQRASSPSALASLGNSIWQISRFNKRAFTFVCIIHKIGWDGAFATTVLCSFFSAWDLALGQACAPNDVAIEFEGIKDHLSSSLWASRPLWLKCTGKARGPLEHKELTSSVRWL